MKNHQIICGDSRAVLQLFQANSVDLIVTDPPYLCRFRDRTGRQVRNDDNPDGVLPVFEQLYRVLKLDSYCISFCGWNAIAEFSGAWASAGFSVVGHIVWVKSYASGQGHTNRYHEAAYVLTKGCPKKPANPINDVLPWSYTGNKIHPTEKSIDVLKPLVREFSRPGDLVLDPFCGSGSTAVAAALQGRRAIGIELERRYCDLARKRLSGMREQQALVV